MASQKAKANDASEAILHRNGRVTECAHSNIHILKDGFFITAPTDNLILPGIARAHLIKACKHLGIPVKETPYLLSDLLSADEIIISSSGISTN
jgi:D-alanine transaminase